MYSEDGWERKNPFFICGYRCETNHIINFIIAPFHRKTEQPK